MRSKPGIWIVLLGGLLCCAGACKKHVEGENAAVGATSTEPYRVAQLGLSIPRPAGWVQDPAITWKTGAQGGAVFQMERESAVAGSPRISVLVEAALPPAAPVTSLQEFLTRNLREMGQLETDGQIRILSVEQHALTLGNEPAYEVQHAYTIGEGDGAIAISQTSVFFIAGGRGVAVTAAGRTELYQPLVASIEEILKGMMVETVAAAVVAPAAVPEPVKRPSIVQPIDLGTIGGKKP